MPLRDFRNTGYKARREYRDAFEEFLRSLDVDLFATLSSSQNTRFQQARPLLGQWFARLDNHYLGRGWARRNSDERTFAVAVAENIGTNLHYHSLVRLPAWGTHAANRRMLRHLGPILASAGVGWHL
jgi:hypothetical protein